MKRLPPPLEEIEQIQVVNWARSMVHIYPDLEYLTASMNGLRVTPGVANKAKSMGIRKGDPDLRLDSPRGSFHGLRIEMKRRHPFGEVSEDQREYINFLIWKGYCVVVCYGSDEAIEVLKDYMNLPEWKDPARENLIWMKPMEISVSHNRMKNMIRKSELNDK